MMNNANLQQAPYDGREEWEIPGGSIDGSTGQAREGGGVVHSSLQNSLKDKIR